MLVVYGSPRSISDRAPFTALFTLDQHSMCPGRSPSHIIDGAYTLHGGILGVFFINII